MTAFYPQVPIIDFLCRIMKINAITREQTAAPNFFTDHMHRKLKAELKVCVYSIHPAGNSV
jgi:hypothetical protein